jgi:hypothetical protein
MRELLQEIRTLRSDRCAAALVDEIERRARVRRILPRDREWCGKSGTGLA